MVACHGWSVQACNESLVAFSYDSMLLVRFDKIDGGFSVRPVCSDLNNLS
jgi:hypothetical protein